MKPEKPGKREIGFMRKRSAWMNASPLAIRRRSETTDTRRSLAVGTRRAQETLGGGKALEIVRIERAEAQAEWSALAGELPIGGLSSVEGWKGEC